MLIPRTPAVQYAQSGWIKVGTGAGFSVTGYHVFSEYSKACANSCAGADFIRTFGSDPSTTKNYQAYLRASDDRIVMTVNGTVLDVLNRDVTCEWSTDWSGQWASENHYYGSDIPGTLSNKLVFDTIRKLDSGGSPSDITSFSNPYSSDPRHDVALDASPSGGKRFRVWTK